MLFLGILNSYFTYFRGTGSGSENALVGSVSAVYGLELAWWKLGLLATNLSWAPYVAPNLNTY